MKVTKSVGKLLALSVLCSMVWALAPAGAQAQNASVYVIHGIPGRDVNPALDPALPVDILVNNSLCLLKGFSFGQIEGPYTLPAGVYNIKISLANSINPCSNAPVIPAVDVAFAAGENASVIAHLTDVGTPTAAKFSNDLNGTFPGQGRLIVHHTAKAPAVDIAVGRGLAMVRRGVGNSPGLTVPNFFNGNQAPADVLAGNWRISISPNGTTTLFSGRSISK